MPQQYVTRSPVAHQIGNPRTAVMRTAPVPWGVVVHTTGSGVVAKAAALGRPAGDVAIGVYLEPDDPAEGIYTPFPHYVIDGLGKIVQICDESMRARHVAITPADREAYLSGAWRGHVSAVGITLWEEAWPGFPSPSHLYPGKSVNEVYLGVELIPGPAPDASGGLYTAAQYEALGALLEDIEARYEITLGGAHLLGHEDVSPLTRWDGGGGWDPGARRARPTFDWSKLERVNGWPFSSAAPVARDP